jgi:hypothetical protein
MQSQESPRGAAGAVIPKPAMHPLQVSREASPERSYVRQAYHPAIPAGFPGALLPEA